LTWKGENASHSVNMVGAQYLNANPKRRALEKEIHTARANLARLEREYGANAKHFGRNCPA
jgi:hypothetical protein